MAVTVEEVATKAAGSFLSGTLVTFATTPAVGDVVVVAIETSGTRLLGSISGLGATWTILAPGLSRVNFAVGIGATTSGAVTANIGTSGNTAAQGYLIRGLVGTPTWTRATDATGTGTVFQGPLQTFGNGDIAVAALATQTVPTSNTWANAPYTTDHAVTGTGIYRAASYAPGSSGSYRATSTGVGTQSWTVGQVILQSGASSADAAVAAALPSLTASVAATSTVTATSAAVLPSLSAAVATTSSIPAAVAAALPSLTASVVATSTVTAAVAAVLPALSSEVEVVADDTSLADVAATLPALSASATATSTGTATMAAELPAFSSAVDVTVTVPTGDFIAAALPALSSSVVVDAGTALEPWTSGAGGEALLNLDTPTGSLEVTYAASEAPTTVVEVPLKWQSHESAVVGGDTSGMVDVDLGVPHIWVDGVDVTYFRGVPAKVAGWQESAPFGWTTTTVTFPQVFHWEETGAGDLEWLYADAPVEIAIVKAGGERLHRFTGFLTSDDPGTGRGRTVSEWGVAGLLWQADLAHHPVPARLDPTEIGRLVPDELNGTPSRRFAPIARVSTPGITSRQRGSTQQSRWQYATDQLATAIRDDGKQWTLVSTGPKSFALVLKDTETVHWTVTAGAPGVELDVGKDAHERIDAVYASGVGPDGYAWSNIFFPDLLPYDPPDYPYSDPDQNVLLGDSDADTLTGTGISDWQRRIRDLGYTSNPIDGVYGSSDKAATYWIQRKRGIQVDGFLGPQTWAATWNIGAVGGDLTTIRLPMAWRPEVEPFLYGANGAVVGNNPVYDPSIIRHEIDVDFGAGVTKEQGREMAQRILERGMDPGVVGTIKLTTCPWEGSRWEMSAGDNVLLKGYRGGDVLARIVTLDADLGSLTVSLTIDSEFRDAMAVVEILNRNRESKPDPARRPGNPSKRSRLDQDQVTPFEGESPAGRLPRMALFEGLWTVWPIPVSEIGEIAKTIVRTSGPACPFCLALFGRPITANQLDSIVPAPLTDSTPWDDEVDLLLDKYGWIETFGKDGQAAGYYPRQESSGIVTGRLEETSSVQYVSQIPPWVWVAMWAPTSCFIQGRFYPAPVQ